MGKYLPLSEIKSRYPEQWVVLTGMRHSPDNRLLGGVVRFASADRKKAHDAAASLVSRAHRMVMFTGKPIPSDFVGFI